MKFKRLLFLLLGVQCCMTSHATSVKLNLSTLSRTAIVTSKSTGEAIEIGEPTNAVYNFDAAAGTYVVTVCDTKTNKDGSVTEATNGTIEMDVPDSSDQFDVKIITCTIYARNTNEDKSNWTVENGDYTFNVKVASREGKTQIQTPGKSTTEGRYTFLAFNGNSYFVDFFPGEKHVSEGYTNLYQNGTLTNNIDIRADIPMGADFTVTVPKEAKFELGRKTSHFVDFIPLEPKSTETEGDNIKYTYTLALDGRYSFRTSMENALTQCGWYRFSKNEEERVPLTFTLESYKVNDPKTIVHDVKANKGYETGDIFVNINERGHLVLNVGETYKAHAMRSWQITDSQTANFFMEPDFHYTILDLNGNPCNNVVTVEQKDGSAWADLKAVGQGTVIVLVTYDAVDATYYTYGQKNDYMGGHFWSAIWPENTAAYVVTVGEGESSVVPNMKINEQYSTATLKNSGIYVDAEHDVFYYLDTEAGFSYTFHPEGADKVTMAYPTIGERMATYSGFGNEGVTKNEDGSYTLLLKEGRQIVRITDAGGKSVYQVLTAKPCHREIFNESREGSTIFQPGDKIRIQYSGLRHPANKMAGIYNMTAHIVYNGIPNGSDLILGKGQYTFGSSDDAQSVMIDLPLDMNLDETPELVMNEGVIQVNGYGDPIGNHRVISYYNGRNANFTAIAHATYFGALPEVRIPLSPMKKFNLKINNDIEGSTVLVTQKDTELNPDSEGIYHPTYGTYIVRISKDGYRCFHAVNTLDENSKLDCTVDVTMELADENAWDGKTLTEPASVDGVYQITSGAELAWLAAEVNKENKAVHASLLNDIDLAGYEWTPIGNSSKCSFYGTFTGNNHKIKGLYIYAPETENVGLFGIAEGGNRLKDSITGLTVYGSVTGCRFVGGIAGKADYNVFISECGNYADVTALTAKTDKISGNTGIYAGGVAGISDSVINCYNVGTIKSYMTAGGVTGGTFVATNCYNIGSVTASDEAGAIGSNAWNTHEATNSFSTVAVRDDEPITIVTDEQMRSGEVAYKLGEAFGQEIGKDEHPVLGGMKVLYDEANNRYYNENGGTSGIDVITADEAEGAVYYNLQGVASETPFKGLNIVSLRDGSVRKIFVR